MAAISIGAVAGGVAAIFAYLGWVRMTTKRRLEVQETMRNHFEGITIETANHAFRIRKVTVIVDANWIKKARHNLLPYGVYGDETRLWCSLANRKTSSDGLSLIRKGSFPDSEIEVIRANSNLIVLGFDTIDEGEICERLDSAEELLNTVFKDA